MCTHILGGYIWLGSFKWDIFTISSNIPLFGWQNSSWLCIGCDVWLRPLLLWWRLWSFFVTTTWRGHQHTMSGRSRSRTAKHRHWTWFNIEGRFICSCFQFYGWKNGNFLQFSLVQLFRGSSKKEDMVIILNDVNLPERFCLRILSRNCK